MWPSLWMAMGKLIVNANQEIMVTKNYRDCEKIITVIKKNITLFVFSTENWKRPIKEIKYLFNLLETYIDSEIENLQKKNIKLKVIGNIFSFPKKLKLKIKRLESLTKNNTKIQINMALNYGARQEIIYFFKKLLKKKNNDKLKKYFKIFIYP